jgi:hypothetical protein
MPICDLAKNNYFKTNNSFKINIFCSIIENGIYNSTKEYFIVKSTKTE